MRRYLVALLGIAAVLSLEGVSAQPAQEAGPSQDSATPVDVAGTAARPPAYRPDVPEVIPRLGSYRGPAELEAGPARPQRRARSWDGDEGWIFRGPRDRSGGRWIYVPRDRWSGPRPRWSNTWQQPRRWTGRWAPTSRPRLETLPPPPSFGPAGTDRYFGGRAPYDRFPYSIGSRRDF